MAGIVHFSRFFLFMESAEHEFLRSLDSSVALEIGGERIGWPRLSASCEYLAPARFEEILEIHLQVLRKGRQSLTYGFHFSRDQVPVARGKLTAACCILKSDGTLTAVPIPDPLAQKIDESKLL